MKIFQTTFNKPVVAMSLLFCSGILGFISFNRTETISFILYLREFIFTHFHWLYVLASALFIFFLLFLALSHYGDIRLGDNDSEAELSLRSWFALLFTAGMGIGIIFLGVAEPLSHLLFPTSNQYIERQAVFQSIFHWSINAWAIYGVIALAIAYFGFRYKLPLSLRSCFYPLLKQRIEGKFGDLIDVLGLCTTIFGIITTLAYSAIRLVSAFEERQIWLSDKLTIQIIIGAVFIVAIGISTQRITKGLRIVSELSLGLSLCLMLFVLFVGPTAYLLSAFTENIGHYLNGFVRVGFKTYVYEPEYQEWFNQWTILYWAWWFSWAPSFGIFIARISKGRTIREFILGVLIVPSLFFILWFTIFGNGAIWVNQFLANGKLGEMLNQTGKLLFSFIYYLPFSTISNLVTFIIVLLFFITTIDFGIYILNNISLKDKSQRSPRWQFIFWGAIITLITFVLFQTGGIEALQGTMLIFSLPFVILMIFMMLSLLKGLRFDVFSSNKKTNMQRWVDTDWRLQLSELLNVNTPSDITSYIKNTALIAMRELRQELIGIYDLDVVLDINITSENSQLTLTIGDFIYQLETVFQNMENEQNILLNIKTNTFNMEKYEIHFLTKNELIADILKQYALYQTTKSSFRFDIADNTPEYLEAAFYR